MWTDQDFMTTNPIGRPYPYNITCAPVDYAENDIPTTCTLGINPQYAVNATNLDQINATMLFAQENNIRLVVTNTGHDMLGRSDGFGGLEIWLRHFRNRLEFQEAYSPINSCQKSNWSGSTIVIDGAYQWENVYEYAKAKSVIVVGGGAISPGAIGGWLSGGGHGPATRNYGMGADQILEARVLLANGQVVTANHCEYTDLFTSIRGGGPGYGIVLGTTVKTYPDVDVVTTHHLYLSPVLNTPDNSNLLDAVTVLLQSFPDLSDAGFAGYGFWSRSYPGPFIGNATSGLRQRPFGPVKARLQAFNDTLSISDDFVSYNGYWSFYEAESGLYDAAGASSILTSRFINRGALTNITAVRNTVEVIAGNPEEYTVNVIDLVSGGQVFADASDETSGLHSAWRTSNYFVTIGRSVALNASNSERYSVMDDMTYVKGAALKELAPDTGGYMNEGDRNDPEWKPTFYGDKYAKHLATKKKYDPYNTFYCATCVGSEGFVERPDFPLCPA
ncbi:hypothetical protein Daus18300_006923 [Diaporthe australafricana]|uniref:FAD-binding PCMH-type domain-containing protein n=1 Tax=Diaporthe australafricana TaxID=127596 RepID=A0ABR3WRC9_9PEZI